MNNKNLCRAKTLDNPSVTVKITRYGTKKFVIVRALADTGAQSNLWGWKHFQDAGFGKNDLLLVSITVQAANKIPIKIVVAFRATVSEMYPKNEVVNCNSVIYVSDSVTEFFLSYETLVELLIIYSYFHTFGS